MAITQSAKKAIRVSEKKKVFNLRRFRAMKDAIKQVKNLALDKKIVEAQALLPKAYQAIDKAMKRGVIKKNNASRKKSRLSALIMRSK